MLLSPVMGTPLQCGPRPGGVWIRSSVEAVGLSVVGTAGRYSRGPGPGCCSRARLVGRAAPRWTPPVVRLAAADAETLDQGAVALDVGLLQVLQETTATPDQRQQTAAG